MVGGLVAGEGLAVFFKHIFPDNEVKNRVQGAGMDNSLR